MTYIPDLTERYPEGFGGICMDNDYGFAEECAMWDAMERSFAKEQQEAMERYMKHEAKMLKWRTAIQKVVNTVIEAPNETYSGKKKLFNGYHLAVCTDNGKHYICHGVNCRNSMNQVVRISWERYEITEGKEFLDKMYRVFGITEEKWELKNGTWHNVLEEEWQW